MLSTEQKRRVSEAITEWLSTGHDRSGNTLAQQSGVSSAYISKIRNGEYQMGTNGKATVIQDSYFYKISDAIGFNLDEELHWDYIKSFKTIQAICRRSQHRKERTLLDGQTGQGKTYGLERYAATHDKVIYIKLTHTMNVRDLLEIMCHKLNIREHIPGNRKKMEAIRERVLSKPGHLVILDEIELCKPNIFLIAKEIADFTERKCGMVLSGMDLKKKIESFASRKRQGFPQLRRRFFPHRQLVPDLSKEEVETVAKNEGITNAGAINVLKQYVRDLDMLKHYIISVKEQQNKHKRKLSGDEVIDLLQLYW